jgi:colanic acid biosynthesis glycosyl transferase WcaI
MPRIIFLNRFFYPDHSATSQIVSDLAFYLAASGRNIHVVTSQQRYNDPDARLPPRELTRGVEIHRVSTTRFGRAALIGRGLDYLSYYLSMRRAVLDLAERSDILVAKTDPPLLSVLAINAAQHCGAHVVNWLQDLYPEIAVELGVPLIQGPVAGATARLRNRSLQRADINVVLGEAMAARLRICGVAEKRITIIPNWTDDHEISSVPPAENPLRREWQLHDKFVVGYSGNLGRAYEFETILATADQLRDNPRIIFIFIGGGYQFDQLALQIKQRGLERSFRFFPYQDRAQLKYSLSVPDVHWLSLKPRLEGLILPSKFYGIAAAGRPIIAITAKDGEIAKLVDEHDCGVVVEPGDAAALSVRLVHLSETPQRCVTMGHHARTMLEAKFTRRQALERWQAVLDNLSSAR